MATAARSATSAKRLSDEEDVQAFDAGPLRAPFALRCAALCIDYIVFVLLPAVWLVAARLLSDNGSASPLGLGIWITAAVLFVLNFLLFPLFRGQSIGKMVTGLTILDSSGQKPAIGKLLLRNSLGYLLTLLTAGLGFIIAGLNGSGRALHDLLAGTVVIRGRRL